MKVNGKEFPYSFSQNRLYEDCPRKYKFRYFDGIVEPSNANLELGTAIHGLFEHWPEKPIEFKETVIRLLGITYYKKLSQEIDEFFKDKEIIGHEIELREPNFIGFIDLVYKTADDKTVLADFKVTKKPKTQKSVYDEGQLLIYKSKFLTQSNIDSENIYVQYVNILPYLAPKLISETEILFVSHLTCNELVRDMEKNIDKIHNQEFPKKTKWCNWCYYKNLCDAEKD
ncbi:MAG: PD-(D/E)XK nuclease family protein [Clostridia bacterium]|nr:PD-(D/E)XK nuclease family protein [Clostridia bacterium]